MKKYRNKYQNDKYLYIFNEWVFNNVIPNKIYEILSDSPVYKHKMIHYWRIQAVTFIFRLNERTNNEVNSIIKNSLGNKLNNSCFNIWIRHGDKYIEMKLLDADKYIPSYYVYKIISKNDIPIYLSTDDPTVIEYFITEKELNTYYLQFERKNNNFSENMKRGAEMTLNFIADVKAALYCEGFSGTRASNVVRLIDELRSTVGLSANAIYLENGPLKFSDTSYEITQYW